MLRHSRELAKYMKQSTTNHHTIFTCQPYELYQPQTAMISSLPSAFALDAGAHSATDNLASTLCAVVVTFILRRVTRATRTARICQFFIEGLRAYQTYRSARMPSASGRAAAEARAATKRTPREAIEKRILIGVWSLLVAGGCFELFFSRAVVLIELIE